MATKKYNYEKVYSVRLHNEQHDEKINEIYNKHKHWYSSMNEFLAQMVYDGASALESDENINRAFNFSEIRKVLQRLERSRDDEIEGNKIARAKLLSELQIVQAQINYLTKLYVENEDANTYLLDRNENKFEPINKSALEDYKAQLVLGNINE
ncbi:MAG: hypothetical protein PHI36_01725 [Bacteroidales bacterium]|nr:hypothetical protein [Bacteroidales bacterium]